MSRAIGAALTAHLASEVTTLATCWKVTRTDGQVFGFTDHDEDLVIGGVTYSAAAGYTRSAIAGDSSLAVNNLEVLGMLDDDSITVADLLAGKWDAAEVRMFYVNWADLTQGTGYLTRGWIGQVVATGPQFTADLRGLTQKVQQTIGEVLTPACRADLYDGRCKVDKASHTSTGTVTAVSSRAAFTASALAGDPTGRYDYGTLTWTSGANDELAMEVKSFIAGAFSLMLPMPYDIAVDDTFSVTWGCDKAETTCIVKFANRDNFRGEPWVPGPDVLAKGPDRV